MIRLAAGTDAGPAGAQPGGDRRPGELAQVTLLPHG